jgi:hypothetical protein
MKFTTPWRTFMYDKMPFRLMNAGETFQRAMDIEFSKEKDKFIVISLDYITVYSGSDSEHLQNLEQVFKKCRKIGLSLNPKKSNFVVQEGKLLGNISRDGIKTYHKYVEYNQHICDIENQHSKEKKRSTILFKYGKFFKKVYP